MMQRLLFSSSGPCGSPWTVALRWLLVVALSIAVAGCAGLPPNVARSTSTAFNAPDQTPLGRLVLERKAQERARTDSAFNLLDTVDAAFGSRLALIDGAQRSLDLQYYAIHADASTEILLQHLRDAARRGVRVRVLLDDFNTVGQDTQVLRLAVEPNVEMRLFNPLSGSRSSLVGRIFTSLNDMARVQKRMHNKLFIADNAMGITGGRNLGDAYFGGDGQSNFIDLEVLAVGPVVRVMSASFDRYWNDELAYPVQALVSTEDLEKLRKPKPSQDGDASQAPATPVAAVPSMPAPTLTSAILPDATPTAVANAERPSMDLRRVSLTWAPALVMVDEPGKIGPGDDEVDAGETVVDGLLHLMQQARQDVLIVSPYFVPGELMMEQFRQLRAKGVRIRVLTNSLASNDAPAAHAGYARYRKALLAQGVELYEMRSDQEGTVGGMGSARGFGSGAGAGGSKSGASRASLHSKAVIIDQRLAVIGSMNLDLRSQRKNSEVALLIRSAALSQQAARKIEATFAQGAYRLELVKDEVVWRAPAGAAFKDAHSEPEASTKLKLMVMLIAPLAPDEML
ncbi:MAG: cardiolipin synthetase (Cardiolipin synthase)-like protein [Ramlibacter sp.]|nr:cardiolipin synthetase (Cardiolipin synthase)-like protein [Ramlibacter sp.]